MIYIAGKYTAKERLKQNRDALRTLGFSVSSTWMDTDFPEVIDDEQMIIEGERDVAEVTNASLLILDTFDESATGGREVELGIALAKDTMIYQVGPKRNIFHWLVDMHFESWDELVEFMDGE